MTATARTTTLSPMFRLLNGSPRAVAHACEQTSAIIYPALSRTAWGQQDIAPNPSHRKHCKTRICSPSVIHASRMRAYCSRSWGSPASLSGHFPCGFAFGSHLWIPVCRPTITLAMLRPSPLQRDSLFVVGTPSGRDGQRREVFLHLQHNG